MTKRLSFEAFTSEDLGFLAELHGDAEVMRFLSSDGHSWSTDVLRGKLQRFIDDQSALGFSKWKVLTRADGAAVGRAGFSIFRQTGEIELGFIFRRCAWSKGYATECATGLSAWLFAHRPDIDHVIAFARRDNLASKRVLEKIGMRATGARAIDGLDHDFYRLHRS
jgi:RimJ/RimL family protein N-acetyltransferase